MPDNQPVADITDATCDIAFTYPEIGADRDICHVYWDNFRWVQVLYDPFREQWSGIHPVLFGSCEAVASRFNLDPLIYTWPEIVTLSPAALRSLGKGESELDVIHLEKVVLYTRWQDLETGREYMAERFSSGSWCLASLDKQAFAWDITGFSFSDSEIAQRYLENYPKTALLGGIPPSPGP